MATWKIRLRETVFPRGWVADNYLKRTWTKNNNETLDMFRWRIVKELNSGCIFIFE